jgi:hypothetical protein
MISVNRIDLAPYFPKCQRVVAKSTALAIYCFAKEVAHIIDVYIEHYSPSWSGNRMFVGP